MTSRRCLLDLNIVLDVVLDRSEAPAAAAVWRAIETGSGEGLVAAHGVTTLYYVVARARGRSFAHGALARFLDVFRIAAVDGIVIKRALDLRWKDFEDAVTVCAAEAAGCDVLVTRDPVGFAKSPIRVVDPRAALVWLGCS